MQEIEKGFENTEELSEAQEYLQMGQMLMGAQKYQDAVQMFDKALVEEPMDKIAYISKGIALASMDEFELAKECFKRCVIIDKNFADAYFQIGNMCFLEDDYQEGMKNYNQAIALGYHSADLYFNLALVHEERDEIEEAIRYYTKASNIDETVPDYIIRKASLQMMIQKYEEALQTLEKVRTRFPDSFEGYHLTAAAYTMLGQYDKADEILSYALNMFPDDFDILIDRMRVLITKGDLESALFLLAEAKQKGATLAERKEILLYEAQIKGQQDKLEEADKLLLEALEIKDGEQFDSEIRYLLIVSYLVQKDFVNMLKIAKQVDKTNHEDPYNLCGLYFEGVAMKALNDESYRKHFQNAIKYYRSISMNNPSRIDSYLFRAMCYKELENYEKAIESIDYIILLQPENGQLHYIKGNIMKEKGCDMAEVEKEYQEAKRLGLDKSFWEYVG